MLRRRTRDDYQSLLGTGAPVALLITDPTGVITYRNPAALELAARVIAARGDTVLAAMGAELAKLVTNPATGFPLTTTVAVERDGQHAAAEVVLDRLGDRFAFTWSDVTARRFRTSSALSSTATPPGW